MQHLKAALERLDEEITILAGQIKGQTKVTRARETELLAVTQKAAMRVDQSIQHLESVLRG